MKVDLVISYVDNSNNEWKYNCSKYTKTADARFFRVGKNQLRYVLRSVEQNLPFINQVFLIVQNKSEVPDYIDTEKVRVVTHDTFIPKKYLPTFNINTILTFLAEIPDLSEHFIYTEDDIFILNELTVDDFFVKDKTITRYHKLIFESNRPNSFESIVMNCNQLVFGKSKTDMWNEGFTIKPHHTLRPYKKSVYRQCIDKYWNKIESCLTRFRSPLNYSNYIVDLYSYKNGDAIDSTTFKNNGIYNNASNEEIVIKANSADTICILDHFIDVDIFENKTLINLFKTKFPNVCKYEKEQNNLKQCK